MPRTRRFFLSNRSIPGASQRMWRHAYREMGARDGSVESTKGPDCPDPAGSVTFDLLPNGLYTLCAQAASGNWLNACEWGAARPDVTVSAAQRTVSTTLVLKCGAAVLIRVDDPDGLLALNERKTPGAHLLLGSGAMRGWVQLF